MKKSSVSMVVLIVVFCVSFAAAKSNDLNFISRDAVTTSLLNQQPDPVEPGDIVDLRFRLENEGQQAADDVEVQILYDFPFTVIGDDTQRFNVLGGRTVGTDGLTVKFKLQVNPGAGQGNHEIRLKHKVKNGNWVLSDSFFVDVRTQDAILLLEDIRSVPSSVEPGQSAQVHINMTNVGDSALRSIRAKLDLDKVPFAPIKTSNERSVSLLPGKQNKQVTFTIVADPDAAVKVHKIPIFLDYIDDVGTTFKFNRTIGVKVEDKPAFLLGVEERTVYRKSEKGNVVVSMANTGAAELKFVSMELMETPDYDVLSNPTVYLGNLESDDFETAEFDIFTKKVKDTMPLLVILRYKDGFNEDKQDIREVPLRIFSSKEAKKFGLVARANVQGMIFSLMILVITSVFWLFMLMDLRKNKMVKYKKLLWFVLVIGTHVIGAIIYFFLGRRKTLGNA